MKELLAKQKELEEKVNEIKRENQKSDREQGEYKNYSEQVLQKQEQLQKLFDELMTDEMKEMMEKEWNRVQARRITSPTEQKRGQLLDVYLDQVIYLQTDVEMINFTTQLKIPKEHIM